MYAVADNGVTRQGGLSGHVAGWLGPDGPDGPAAPSPVRAMKASSSPREVISRSWAWVWFTSR